MSGSCGGRSSNPAKLNVLPQEVSDSSASNTPPQQPSEDSEKVVNQFAADQDDGAELRITQLGVYSGLDSLVGPRVTIVGVTALQQIYTRVFGTNPAKRTLFFFSPAEMDLLGRWNITEVVNQVASSSQMTQMKTVSLDYLTGLRTFLGDSCKELVAAELANESAESNILISPLDEKISTKINTFMTSLFGYPPDEGEHFLASAYVKAFKGSLAAEPLPADPEAQAVRRKLSYEHLCITLGTDPRVYTR
jgi:hypothetical protein